MADQDAQGGTNPISFFSSLLSDPLIFLVCFFLSFPCHQLNVNQLNGLKLKMSSKKLSGSLKKTKGEQEVEYTINDAEDAAESALLDPLVVKNQKLAKSDRSFKRLLSVKLAVDPSDSLNAIVQPAISAGHPYVQPEVMELRYQPIGSFPGIPTVLHLHRETLSLI